MPDNKLSLMDKINMAVYGLGVKGHERLVRKIHQILAQEFERDPDSVRAWLSTKSLAEEENKGRGR